MSKKNELLEGGIDTEKKCFTLEEHKEIGAKLKLYKKELVHLSVKIAETYPQDTLDITDMAIENIDKLRSNLDEQVCKEYPDLENAIFWKIYY